MQHQYLIHQHLKIQASGGLTSPSILSSIGIAATASTSTTRHIALRSAEIVDIQNVLLVLRINRDVICSMREDSEGRDRDMNRNKYSYLASLDVFELSLALVVIAHELPRVWCTKIHDQGTCHPS